MSITIPAVTLNTAHSVGRSGITICMGIQNGGFALELQKQNMNRQNYNHIGINFHKQDKGKRGGQSNCIHFRYRNLFLVREGGSHGILQMRK
jgi:hypothetical protein